MTLEQQIAAATLVLVMLAGGAPAAKSLPPLEGEARPPKEDWRIESWEGGRELPAGRAFTVRNAHGDVHARRSEQPKAEVFGVIQRHVEDQRQVRIELADDESGVVAEVRQPASDETPIAWAHRRVDLTVYVPEGAPWRVATGAGRIDARRIESEVEASTESGDMILILRRGSVNAATRSGAVKVNLGEVAWAGARLIESESGGLSVSVPHGVDLDLEIDTAGEIEIDGVTAAVAHPTGDAAKPIRLRLGKGGRTLRLRSATGNVSFRSLE